MSISALPSLKYQLASVIIAIYIAGYALTEFDPTLMREYWMKNYEVFEFEVDGVNFYGSYAQCFKDLADNSSNPLYAAGVACPCRPRDGYNQPFPICPD